jgi:hypothetical protein
MTPYGRRTPTASAASSIYKPDMTLAASRAGRIVRCGISSVRLNEGRHYRGPAFTELISHSVKLPHVHYQSVTVNGAT